MSGGGGDTQTIQKSDPWEGQQPHLLTAMEGGKNLYENNPSSYYSGQTYLPFNQYQQAGIGSQLGNINDLYGISSQAQSGLGSLFNASDPNSQLNQQWAGALGQNLYGNIDTTLGQLQRGFGYQGEDLGYQAGNLIGQQGRAYDASAGQMLGDIGNIIGQQQRGYDVASGRTFADMANYGNLLGRNYDAQSARSIDDVAALRERQMRDYDVSRNLLTEDLQKQLPYLASDANLAGQAGSTRQGIAEGLAIQNAQNRLSELGRTQDETLASNLRSAGIGLGDLARSQSENLGAAGIEGMRGFGELSRSQAENLGNVAYEGTRGIGNLARSQAENLGQSIQGGVLGLNQLGREQAGQYGSAATNLTNQANLSLADFMSGQYGQGLDATKAGLLAAPTAAGLSQMPYQSLYQVGDMIRNQDMLPLQEDISRYYYNQQAPWNDLNQYASIVQGLPAGLGTSTSTGPSGSSLGSAIGGGLAGAGVANSLGLLGGAAGFSNPLGWGLVGLGGLAGWL